MHTMRIRTKYQLKAPEGVEIQYRDHEAALLAAGKKAIPDKAVTVCEDHLLVDELSGNEVRAFGRVVAKIAGLNSLGLTKISTVFCELNGEPIHSKDRLYELAAEDDRWSEAAYCAKHGLSALDHEIDG